jgi:hypothetical protein
MLFAGIFEAQVTLGNVLATIALAALLTWLFRRLSGRLSNVIVGAHDAIGELNSALTRLELLETRLNATEHRLAIVERYQLRVIDAETVVRAAGMTVPPPGARE